MSRPNEYNARFSMWVSDNKISQARVAIIGCGSVGRRAAIELHTAGVENILLCDHDTVDAVNIGTQGWRPEDIGRKKVDALADIIHGARAISKRFPAEFQRSDNWFLDWAPDCVISAVDSMIVRKHILDNLPEDTLLIDPRMAALSGEVHVAYPEGREDYSKTIIDDERAYQAPSCTIQATGFCAALAAAHSVGHIIRALSNSTSTLAYEMQRFKAF